jgi:hypothetical protein
MMETAAAGITLPVVLSVTCPLSENVVGVDEDGDGAEPLPPLLHATPADRKTKRQLRLSIVNLSER